MANEIQFSHATGKTAYSVIRDQRSGFVWSLSGGSSGALEGFTSGNWRNYAISATEQGVSSYYTANFPVAAAPGIYSVLGKEQAGANPLQTDASVANGDIHWGGSTVFPLSDVATSGQLGTFNPIRLARGIAVSGFMFKLVSSADHFSAFTSGVVSGQIARDGGSFGALQSGVFTERGLGWYRTDLTSGDLLATTVALTFSANGISGGSADQRDFFLVLQRTSGQ